MRLRRRSIDCARSQNSLRPAIGRGSYGRHGALDVRPTMNRAFACSLRSRRSRGTYRHLIVRALSYAAATPEPFHNLFTTRPTYQPSATATMTSDAAATNPAAARAPNQSPWMGVAAAFQ